MSARTRDLSRRYAEEEARAIEMNRTRAAYHIGKPCPGCDGTITELIDVTHDWPVNSGSWTMLLRYRCSGSCSRIYARELFEIPRSAGGSGLVGGTPMNAAILAACLSACV